MTAPTPIAAAVHGPDEQLLRETDAWTRTLCLLTYAVHEPGAAATLDPKWVAPGLPRALLLAIQARPLLADHRPDLACLVADDELAQRSRWLCALLDDLAEWEGTVAFTKGRRLARALAAQAAAPAERPIPAWERSLAIARAS